MDLADNTSRHHMLVACGLMQPDGWCFFTGHYFSHFIRQCLVICLEWEYVWALIFSCTFLLQPTPASRMWSHAVHLHFWRGTSACVWNVYSICNFQVGCMGDCFKYKLYILIKQKDPE